MHKLRYDYEVSDLGGKLVLHMPSAVHEDFIRSLESTIEKELASLANQLSTKDETIAAEIRRIHKSGSTTLQYTIVGSQAPGLVVEVSYSQRSKKLSQLVKATP